MDRQLPAATHLFNYPNQTMKPTQYASILLLAGCLASVFLMLLGLCIGSNGFENLLFQYFENNFDLNQLNNFSSIVWPIRMPRSLGAWSAGALLGLSGALAQGLFRNPLADPYLLGSASGASLGVALVLIGIGGTTLFDNSYSLSIRLGINGAAFIGSILAVLLTFFLAKGIVNSLRLLLSGVVVSVVLGAATQLLMLLSPGSLQNMQAFLLGSTAWVDATSAIMLLLIWLVCCLAAMAMSPVLDGLSLGQATAISLGLPVEKLRMFLLLTLALAIGTAVAQTGLIAFVGLAAPHLIRSLIKTHHAFSILLSSMMGGLLLLTADILARSLIAPQELPLGVLTAILGGGYLLWLMHRSTFSAGDAL
jgi:iron complex transport system permease protein